MGSSKSIIAGEMKNTATRIARTVDNQGKVSFIDEPIEPHRTAGESLPKPIQAKFRHE